MLEAVTDGGSVLQEVLRMAAAAAAAVTAVYWQLYGMEAVFFRGQEILKREIIYASTRIPT